MMPSEGKPAGADGFGRRRWMMWAPAALGTRFLRGAEAAEQQPRVVVVTSIAVPAYKEALDGFTRAFPEPASVVTLEGIADGKGSGAVSARIVELRPRLVVAIGTQATQEAAAEAAGVPVISTMVLGSPPEAPQPLATLSLELPFGTVLAELRRLCPGRRRVGVIRNPAGAQGVHDYTAAAKRHGFSATVADCSSPGDLNRVFVSFKDRVDFVWLPPDGSLYTSTTVKPLVLASLRNRLPIAAFSESFVRAGAAIGIYPDFRDIGEQTAELVQRCLQGQFHGTRETPRLVKVGVNQRVARLVGLECSLPTEPDGRTAIIK